MHEREGHQARAVDSESGDRREKVPMTARLLLRESLTARAIFAAVSVPASVWLATFSYSARMPASLRPLTRTSFGHLTRHSAAGWSASAASQTASGTARGRVAWRTGSSGRRIAERGQHILIGQAVEAVAAHAVFVEARREREPCGILRHIGVEGGVEAGDLR